MATMNPLLTGHTENKDLIFDVPTKLPTATDAGSDATKNTEASDKEKEGTKQKVVTIVKILKESSEALSREASSNSDFGESTSDDTEDDDSLQNKLRSISCPTIPQLTMNPQEKSSSSARSTKKQTLSDTEETSDGKSHARTLSDTTSSAPVRKPRSLSMKASSTTAPSSRSGSQTSRADCQTHALRKKELVRQQDFKSEVQVLSSFFSFFSGQHHGAYFYAPSQELMEKLTAEVKGVNQRTFESIDEVLNQNGDYYNVTLQINRDFTLFVQHVTDFYHDIQELYKVLHSDHAQIFAKGEVLDKQVLCGQLADYLAKDKRNIEAIKAFNGTFLQLLLSQKKTALSSMIKKHIINQYVLIKTYMQEIGDENIHLEKHGEKVWVKVNNQGGSHKILANDLLLKIPRSLVQAKLMFEELCKRITSRIAMRNHIPSIVEKSGIKMLTEWVALINKGEEKLESEEEKE